MKEIKKTRNGWTLESKNFLGVSKAKKNKRKREKRKEKGRPLGKYPVSVLSRHER